MVTLVNKKTTAIDSKWRVLDKWKILIHNEKDRGDFSQDLTDIAENYYNAGLEEGIERERKEQERLKSSTILPLEKKNDIQR